MAMNETELAKFLDNIYKLTPEQLEKIFQGFHETFSSRYHSFNSKLPVDALAWRTRQAWLLLEHRNDRPLPPRR